MIFSKRSPLESVFVVGIGSFFDCWRIFVTEQDKSNFVFDFVGLFCAMMRSLGERTLIFSDVNLAERITRDNGIWLRYSLNIGRSRSLTNVFWIRMISSSFRMPKHDRSIDRLWRTRRNIDLPNRSPSLPLMTWKIKAFPRCWS